MLNSDSRNRSAVGRISRDDGDARLRPFNRPPTTRIRGLTFAPLPLAGRGRGWGSTTEAVPGDPPPRKGEGDGRPRVNNKRPWKPSLLVARLQVAFAVIAALRAPRRTEAAGLGLIARARLVAASALNQHAAALAVGNQAALAGWLERLFRWARIGVFIAGFWLALHRTGEVRARQHGNLLAELLAQHARFDLLDLAFGKLAQLKRPVGHPDQPVHFEAEMRHHVADFAVLAFADRKHQPDIGAMVALQRRIDRPVFDAVDFDAFFQLVELGLRHFAMGANAIAPQPAGVGQFERARQPAIIGQQQQALGIEIEPADRDQPRQTLRQIIEYRRPAFRVGMGGHQAARLVKHEQAGALARRQRLAVDGHDIIGGDVERRRIDHTAVDRDAALPDPFLGVAARGETGAGHHLGNALASFLFARGPCRAFLEVRLALAIFAAAAECRAFGKYLAVVLIVAARTVGDPWLAARMLLPIGAAFRPLARPIEFRAILAGTLGTGMVTLGTILARARKARAFVAASVLTRFVVTRLVKTSGAVARRARVASDVIGRAGVAFLPGL